MNIHRIVSEAESTPEIPDIESPIGPHDGTSVAIVPRSQALWVLIAVSIVVGVNGFLSWL